MNRQCADYTLRFFADMLSRGVQKIFIHSGASGTVALHLFGRVI